MSGKIYAAPIVSRTHKMLAQPRCLACRHCLITGCLVYTEYPLHEQQQHAWHLVSSSLLNTQ